MAYNAIQDNIYNYYLTTYAPRIRDNNKFDTHKKSELRSLYNSMVKLNKESPLYMISNMKRSARLAMGLKESARSLQKDIASLGGELESEELLNRKAAYSSNENIASAKYIGSSSDAANVPTLEMEVQSLASGQTNLGNFLKGDTVISLPPDTYSFDIGINDMNYEFQFNIHAGETNRNIQERLSRLINHSNIGLKAEIIEGDEGTSALRIDSEATGLKPGKSNIFSVTDDKTSKTSGMVSYLGLDYNSHKASNARFTINGEARESATNSFILDKFYEIELKGTSSEENPSSVIGLKADYESLADNITQLIGSYNAFLGAVDSFQNLHNSSGRLKGEMNGIASLYKDNFQQIGLNMRENGSIDIDRETLSKAVRENDTQDQFRSIKNFSQQLFHKTNQISLNPMKYVDKTVVAYKNPGHNFPSPYVPSSYSGMLFNFYC